MEEKNMQSEALNKEFEDGEFMLEPVPVTARRSTKSQFMVLQLQRLM